MNPEKHRKLADRVAKAADAALAAGNFVSPVDVLVRIGWLDPGAVKLWQQGRVDYLEGVVQTNSPRISEAMKLLRAWAAAKQLVPSETHYVARTPGRETLRFSKSGNPTIETLYRTHWVSGELSEAKRKRLTEKASRAPELVVISPLNTEWRCNRCGGTGDLLVMESGGPECLPCVGLNDLDFLPAGDPLLTRRAKTKSPRHAVVMRFSKTRGRYERSAGRATSPGGGAARQVGALRPSAGRPPCSRLAPPAIASCDSNAPRRSPTRG
jgi:hypothetical protein